MEIVTNQITSLRRMEKDERWLQDWICDDPSRLGLGNITIKEKELRQYVGKGGRLDILAYNAGIDTFYEIEIMLGECDSDHGFRVLDYWARERLKKPDSKHVAVLVAEDLSGRYKTLLETLPQYLPFIAIELKTLLIKSDPPIGTTFSVIFSQPDELIVKSVDEPDDGKESLSLNDEESWTNSRGADFVNLTKEMHKIVNEKIGTSKLDFSAKSYISLKKGSRCWLPMWPRRDGFYVYIPGGPGGAEDQPSDFHVSASERLAELGITPSWNYKYNAGANPIAFNLPAQFMSHSIVLQILSEAYQFA